jgi:hypothetical protein
MRFRCKWGFHKYEDKETSITKRTVFGVGMLPGIRLKQVCEFCGSVHYINLNLSMPRRLLNNKDTWR